MPHSGFSGSWHHSRKQVPDNTRRLTTIEWIYVLESRDMLCPHTHPVPLLLPTGLKELELSMGYRPCSSLFVPRDLPVFDCLAPALKQLTGLTKLQVSGFRFKPQHLPNSLLELHASRMPGAAQVNWLSLQSVTRLVLGSDDYEVSQREANLQQGDVLPPRLQHLQLNLSGKRHGTVSLLPVLQLSHLTGLSLALERGVYPAQVQQLVGMSQLKALDVFCKQVRDARGILELGQVLSAEALPLKYFGVHWANLLASTIQPCRHLTCLDLSHIDLLSNRELQQLGEQLRHLPALHTFHMCGLRLAIAAEETHESFTPLVKVLVKLPTLRVLSFGYMGLGNAAECLSAATQLQELHFWDTDVSDTVKASLCASLQQHGVIVTVEESI